MQQILPQKTAFLQLVHELNYVPVRELGLQFASWPCYLVRFSMLQAVKQATHCSIVRRAVAVLTDTCCW